ncbi:radical SAM protein [Candidatus Woesearchaeota archaeon]|nr:radical SAM protein [Candidatus Woesearchaeota archaeon]
MRVTLVQAPVYDRQSPSLALAYLSSVLAENDYDVNIVDLNRDFFKSVDENEKFESFFKKFRVNYINQWYQIDIDYFVNVLFYEKFKKHSITEDEYGFINSIVDNFVGKILQKTPDVIGFSVYQSSALFSLLTAREIKKKKPETVIIFGGPDCLNSKEEFFLKQDYIDFVVFGEGEVTIVELLDSLEMGVCYPESDGVMWKNENKIYRGKNRELIKDLDRIPYPNFDLFNLADYNKVWQLPVLMTRGCTGNCYFCFENNYYRCFRKRNPAHVFYEIKRNLRKYNIYYYAFNDSLINGDLYQLEKFCDLVIKENLNIKWWAQVRPRRMPFDLLKKMRRAGCYHLFFGIESASQKVLNDMRKGTKVEIIKETLRLSKKAGFKITSFWMFGYPTETDKDFKMTCDFVKENKKNIDFVYATTLILRPGSIIYSDIDKFDIKLPEFTKKYPEEICSLFPDLNFYYLYYWTSQEGRNNADVRHKRYGFFKDHARKIGLSVDEGI